MKGVKLLSPKTHAWIQYWSFVLIAVGLPFTKVLLSFGLVFACANYLLEGNYRDKIQQIKQSTFLKTLVVFYLLIIVGTFWSWDVAAGLKDIKSRLPLLALPLILSTGPELSKKQIDQLIYFFLAILSITSIYNVLHYNNIIGTNTDPDIRSLSAFTSHIRYGLLIAIGFGACIWMQLRQKKWILHYALLSAWFVFYTIYSQTLSGVIALGLVVLMLVIYFLHSKSKVIVLTILFGSLAAILYLVGTFVNISHEEINCERLPSYTENGNRYDHSCETFSEINGKALLAYYCELEMYNCWTKASEKDFYGRDAKGEALRMTAARYMTAKGLKKDAVGFKKLTSKDIQNIELGFTYPEEKDQIIMPRINGVKYQLLNSNNPNGASLLQRVEHWKASIFIIRNHWLTGVGTGGSDKAFKWAYNQIDSPLTDENRKRSHNMFFAITINYGIAGLALFVFLLYLIARLAWIKKDFMALTFIVATYSSFLIEDTLETQLGVTIFGFFTALLVQQCRSSITKSDSDIAFSTDSDKR